MPSATPMFPLGSVLVPGMPLPLHVFEARYRTLVQDCLEGDHEFGVVLIERGSEVGGGDDRTSVGTLARIVEAARFDDGRWAVGAVGVHRIQVQRWLPDDPYPRAEVERWPEDPSPVDPAARAAVEACFRRAVGLAAELGVPAAPATVELAADDVAASYQMVVGAPLGPADRHQALAAPGPARRIALLDRLLADQVELLEGRLAMGAGGDGDLGSGFGDLAP